MYLILMELIKTIITSLGKNSVNNLKYKNFNKQLFTSISPELNHYHCCTAVEGEGGIPNQNWKLRCVKTII